MWNKKKETNHDSLSLFRAMNVSECLYIKVLFMAPANKRRCVVFLLDRNNVFACSVRITKWLSRVAIIYCSCTKFKNDLSNVFFFNFF